MRPQKRLPPRTLLGIQLDLLLGLVAQRDPVRTVHLLGDDLHLLGQAEVGVVQVLELGLALARLDDGLGECNSALAAARPVVGRDGLVGTDRERIVLDELELGGGVVAVDKTWRQRRRASSSLPRVDTHENWLTATTTFRPNFLAF